MRLKRRTRRFSTCSFRSWKRDTFRTRASQSRFPQCPHHHDEQHWRRDDSAQHCVGLCPKRDEAKEAESSYEAMRDKLLDQLKKEFRPEFLNRLDGVVVFRALSRDEIKQSSAWS